MLFPKTAFFEVHVYADGYELMAEPAHQTEEMLGIVRYALNHVYIPFPGVYVFRITKSRFTDKIETDLQLA